MRTLIQTIPILSYILSGRSFSKMVKTLLKLWYFYVSRKIFKIKRGCSFNFEYNNLKFSLLLKLPMDIAVLKEIFIDEEYNWFPSVAPKFIIDLGAHIGDTALYYHCHYPDAQIIAVEPSPENFQRLVENTKSVSSIHPVQAAIGPKNGSIVLNLLDSSLGHSVMQRKESSKSVKVEQIDLQTLFSRFDISRVDLIKFDIEGAEFTLFEGLESPELFSENYIGELHYDLAGSEVIDIQKKFNNFNIEIEELSTKRSIIRASKKL